MDKLVNWSLKDEGDKCKNCGMEKDGNCCKDEHKFVKNILDQGITGTIQLLQSPATDTHFSFISFVDDHSYSIINEYPTNPSPPIRNGLDILILNSVFRI
jgi:hypothetical protein